MKNKKLKLEKLYLHDAIFNGIKINNIQEKGSHVEIFLEIYLNEHSKERIKIKFIFKSVEKLLLSTDFNELYDNSISGNIDFGYAYNRGYILNFFGGLVNIETSKKPKVVRLEV